MRCAPGKSDSSQWTIYGGSGGSPTEENNVADAIAAYDHLVGLRVPAGKIVAYGESLGSGQAVRLAVARPVSAVVLEVFLATAQLDTSKNPATANSACLFG